MTAWQRDAVSAFIALGANLGDAAATVRRAIDGLAQLPQTQLLAWSPLYASAPVDAQGPDYVNAVAQVRTGLTAPELLQHLGHGQPRHQVDEALHPDAQALCLGVRQGCGGKQAPDIGLLQQGLGVVLQKRGVAHLRVEPVVGDHHHNAA